MSYKPEKNPNLYSNLVFPPRQTVRQLIPRDIDQCQVNQTSSITAGEANATTKKNKVAQSFTCGKTPILGAKIWKEANSGTFTGTVTVSIQADSAGSPSGTALATQTISNATWNAYTNRTLISVTFTAPYVSIIGTTYWLVVETSTADNTNRINIGTVAAGGYTGGSVKSYNVTDGWTAVSTIDLTFFIITNQPNITNLSPYITRSTAATYSSRLWNATSLQDDTKLAGTDFTFTRAGGWISGSSYPGFFYSRPSSVDYGSSGNGKAFNAFSVSFMYTGIGFSIWLGGYQESVILKIDDQYYEFTPIQFPNDGDFWYINVTFPYSGRKKIEIVGSYGTNSYFAGVYTSSSDTIEPVNVRGPRMIIVGDSFTEGSNATALGGSNYCVLMSDILGWDDIWTSGVGATGYLSAPGGKLTYRQRLSTDVLAFNPDIVMFTGGTNDVAAGYTAAQIAAEALLCFQAVKAALPNAIIICVSPFLTRGAPYVQTPLLAVRPLLKTNIESVGGIFLDIQQLPLPATVTTPMVTTLTSSATAGATTLATATTLHRNQHYQFADGTTVRVLNDANGIDNLYTSQAKSATLTQVGQCLWTGNGYVGATTGVGNCDVLVDTDGTHPTQAGHEAIAEALASLLMAKLRNRVNG